MAVERPNFDNFNVHLMKEVDLLVGGHFLALASEFAPEVLEDSDTYDYYGENEQAYFKTINGGQLQVTAANARENQPLLDILTNQKPDPNKLHAYYPNTKAKADAMRLFRTDEQDGYREVEFYSAWNAVVDPTVTGGPNDRGTYQVSGRCEIPLKIVPAPGLYIAIISDVVELTNGEGTLTNCTASGVAANLRLDPVAIPDVKGYRNNGKYALSIELQQRNGPDEILKKYARIYPKGGLTPTVDATGAFTIDVEDLRGTGFAALADVTHAFVHYLWIGATIPAGYTNGLLGSDGLPFKGRLD